MVPYSRYADCLASAVKKLSSVGMFRRAFKGTCGVVLIASVMAEHATLCRCFSFLIPVSFSTYRHHRKAPYVNVGLTIAV